MTVDELIQYLATLDPYTPIVCYSGEDLYEVAAIEITLMRIGPGRYYTRTNKKDPGAETVVLISAGKG